VALRAIVFDFDGVIANSEPLHYRGFRDVLAGEGIALDERDYYARLLGFDDVGVFQRVGREQGAAWGAATIADLVARKAVRLEALERDVSVLFPGAADAIRRAADAVPIAIASGALGAEIRRVLDRESLTRYFTAIVSANDTPVSKPAPDPYLHAVARLSAAAGAPISPASCVAIEDSRWGLQSARVAGLKTVAVTSSYDASELAGADLVIGSVADLSIEQLVRILAGSDNPVA
jgi:beta-phosphoglucomutase-like phosphatase (HAD superfamily)